MAEICHRIEALHMVVAALAAMCDVVPAGRPVLTLAPEARRPNGVLNSGGGRQ